MTYNPHIIYIYRGNATDPPQTATWHKVGAGFILSCNYREIIYDMSNRWRFRHDDQEGGDLADWLEHGPFHAMRYYVSTNTPPPT